MSYGLSLHFALHYPFVRPHHRRMFWFSQNFAKARATDPHAGQRLPRVSSCPTPCPPTCASVGPCRLSIDESCGERRPLSSELHAVRWGRPLLLVDHRLQRQCSTHGAPSQGDRLLCRSGAASAVATVGSMGPAKRDEGQALGVIGGVCTSVKSAAPPSTEWFQSHGDSNSHTQAVLWLLSSIDCRHALSILFAL